MRDIKCQPRLQIGKKNKDNAKRRGSRRAEGAVDPAQASPMETIVMVPHGDPGRSTITRTAPESPDSSHSPPRTCYASLVSGTTPLPTTTDTNTNATRATRRRKGGGPGGKFRRSTTGGGGLQAPSPGKTTTPLTIEELSESMLTEEAIRAAAGRTTTRELHDVTRLALVVDSSQISVEGVWGAVPNLHTLTLDGSRLLSFRDLGVGLRHLNTLSLESSFVEDLDGIGALSGLRELRLARNRVSDVTPLACHATLQVLGLEQNRLSDMNALEILSSIPLLYSLNLSGNPLMESLGKLRDRRGRGVVHKLTPQIKLLDGTHLSSREGDPVDAHTLDEADDLICQGASRARAAWAEEEETEAAAAARINVAGENGRRHEGRREGGNAEAFRAGSGDSSSSRRPTGSKVAGRVARSGPGSPPRPRPEQGVVMHWDSDLTQGGRQALSGNPRHNTQQSAERVSEWRRETCSDSVPEENSAFAPLDASVPPSRLGTPPALSSSALEGGFDRQLRLGGCGGGTPATDAWASLSTSAASASIAAEDDGGRDAWAVGKGEQRISSGRPWTTGGLVGGGRPTPPEVAASETPGSGRANAEHNRRRGSSQRDWAAAEEENRPGGEQEARHHPRRRRPQTAKESGKRSGAPNPDDSSLSWQPVWESLQTAELISTPRLARATTTAAKSKDGRVVAGGTSSAPAGGGGGGGGDGDGVNRKMGSVDFGRQRRARATVRVARGQDVDYLKESDDDDAYSTPEGEGAGTSGGDDSEEAGDRAQIKKRALEISASASNGARGPSCRSPADPPVIARSPSSPPATAATAATAAATVAGSHERARSPRPWQASTPSEKRNGQLPPKARRRETASLRSRRSLAVMDDDTCSSSSNSSEDEGGCVRKASEPGAAPGGEGEERPARMNQSKSCGDGPGGARNDAGGGGGGGDDVRGWSSSPRREPSLHASRMLGFDLRKSLAAIDEWTDKATASGCDGTPRQGAAKAERGCQQAPFFVEHTIATSSNSPFYPAARALNQADGREVDGKSLASAKAGGVLVAERSTLTMPHKTKKNHGAPAITGIHIEDIDEDDDNGEGEAVLSVAAARAALGISKEVTSSTAAPRGGRSARGAPSMADVEAITAEIMDLNGPAGGPTAAIEYHRKQRSSGSNSSNNNSSSNRNTGNKRRGGDARGDRLVPSTPKESSRGGGAGASTAAAVASPGLAVGMSDEELKGMLKQQPRMVPELRTKESFREFFQGMEAERMSRLLRGAYEGNLPADQVDKKVKKRLGLVGDILAW